MTPNPLDRERAAGRVVADAALTPSVRRLSRISQEQLAAAERARLYHAGKLRAYASSGAAVPVSAETMPLVTDR